MSDHAEALRLFRAKHLFDKPIADALDAAIAALSQPVAEVGDAQTGEQIISLLVAGGFVDPKKVDEARAIIASCAIAASETEGKG